MRNKWITRFFPVLALLLLAPWPVAYAYDAVESGSEGGHVALVPRQQEYTSHELLVASDDSSFHKQWYLPTIRAPQAWQITSGGSDVLVAVLDSGIDQTHKDLAGKVVASINFTQSPTVDDLYGHGTHIAGIIAADDDVGIVGLAYNCSLMNVKVCEDDGSCDSATVAEGIIWAVDNGAKVVNMSLTITKTSPILEDAVDYAWDKGAVVVAAAGNNYSSTPVYPAAYSNAIAVAATDKDDSVPGWSNRGDWISIGAPGVDIYSTLSSDSYGYKSGTSSAAALVSGEAALLFTIVTDSNGNGHVNDEVRHRIETNCDEVEIDGLARGRINLLKAARGNMNTLGAKKYGYSPRVARKE